MNQKKIKGIGKKVNPASIDYTFINETDSSLHKNGSPQKEDAKMKRNVKRPLRDLTRTKIRYKSVRQSPKTQAGHSPVYE